MRTRETVSYDVYDIYIRIYIINIPSGCNPQGGKALVTTKSISTETYWDHEHGEIQTHCSWACIMIVTTEVNLSLGDYGCRDAKSSLSNRLEISGLIN